MTWENSNYGYIDELEPYTNYTVTLTATNNNLLSSTVVKEWQTRQTSEYCKGFSSGSGTESLLPLISS